MTDVYQLPEYLNTLLSKLNNQQISKLATTIGQEIRKNQKKRISQQQNPDGSAYVPRKNLRSRSGKIRRKMFNKIKTAKYLKLEKTSQGVEIGFKNALISRIATVHQYGLVDTVDKHGRIKVRYAQRTLLGFTEQDIELTEQTILNFIESSL